MLVPHKQLHITDVDEQQRPAVPQLVACLTATHSSDYTTDTDADRMQIVSMTHEEWIKSFLSNPPRRDTQT